MYTKAFITRVTIHSFSSLVAQLHETQTKMIRLIGFASFLKVDLKQICGKFSKWLKLLVIAFDVYMNLGVPIEGRQIIKITKSSIDEEYDKNVVKLISILEFILVKKDRGKSFKRNFITFLVNCFFSKSKNYYCSKSVLKYVKDVNQIASLDYCLFVFSSVRHCKESKATKGVESFNPYAVCFKLPDVQKFSVIAFDVYYEEVPAVWLKEWEIDQNASELVRMSEFILAKKDGGESFKRNFIIYLWIEELLLQQVCPEICEECELDRIPRLMPVRTGQQPNRDNVGPSFSPTLALSGPNSEAQILVTTSMVNASISVDKEEHRENILMDQAKKEMKRDDSLPSFSVGLGLSQPNILKTTFVLDPNITGKKDDDNEDDDDGTLLRFPLRNTS
ncbi:hypothetical protein Cgig2_007970 [Carnegiea gigantea]|uniref:Uncharacterized protein n=1 Tax=Carnegiea gigantea TaxID=171969 RepID=A0A9Q1GMD5_9CARY|nr:hypothetical protein Cgig2_007970 [Carnegiea gigantea]